MIKNDRQYRITKAQAARFSEALEGLPETSSMGVDPIVFQAQRDGIQSQLEDLERELAEYEFLKSGRTKSIAVNAIGDLPKALIRARIAAGLTQKDLALRLNLKEQQIQRYEATDYASANFTRIREVMDALGMDLEGHVPIQSDDPSSKDVFDRLAKLGLDRELVLKRILPADLQEPLARKSGSHNPSVLVKAAALVGRVFSWDARDILSGSPLQLNPGVVGQARFKLAAKTQERRLAAYTIYAHYLAGLVLKATQAQANFAIPDDPQVVRKEIMNYGYVTFPSIVKYSWDCGVPVLPLLDKGAFHAACWRIGGRNLVVLKQSNRTSSRWSFDLLHELWHASQDSDLKEFGVIEFEETILDSQDAEDEAIAHRFAGDVLLDGAAESLAQECVREARGRVALLKDAVTRVGTMNDIPVDALANYLAWRLSVQGINWWGAAANLQVASDDPWAVARDELLERVDFDCLDSTERELLIRAMQGEEGDRDGAGR